MKHILAPILLMTLLFPALAFGETMDDLVERDGFHYPKFSEVPFTGKVTGKTQGSIKDGKKHGPYVTYWDNGQLSSKGTYKDNMREGPWVFYTDNGTKRFTAHRYSWDEGTGTYRNGVKVD
jgi:antitoxin component YwqK of YwqJK toxin-antitoxin module